MGTNLQFRDITHTRHPHTRHPTIEEKDLATQEKDLSTQEKVVEVDSTGVDLVLEKDIVKHQVGEKVVTGLLKTETDLMYLDQNI